MNQRKFSEKLSLIEARLEKLKAGRGLFDSRADMDGLCAAIVIDLEFLLECARENDRLRRVVTWTRAKEQARGTSELLYASERLKAALRDCK